MVQGGNYSFGRGAMGPSQLRLHRKFMREIRKASAGRERDRIASISDKDTIAIMARTIVEAANKRGAVTRQDFHQAGVPDARIDAHFEPAMARAPSRQRHRQHVGAAMSLLRAFADIFGVTGTVAIFGAEGFALALICFHLYSIFTLV